MEVLGLLTPLLPIITRYSVNIVRLNLTPIGIWKHVACLRGGIAMIHP